MPDRETEEQAIAYLKALTMPQETREVLDQIETRQQEAAIPQPDPSVSELSNEQIIAGLWRAANAPLTEKELAIKERAAALAETKTPEPTLDAERQRRHQQRI